MLESTIKEEVNKRKAKLKPKSLKARYLIILAVGKNFKQTLSKLVGRNASTILMKYNLPVKYAPV